MKIATEQQPTSEREQLLQVFSQLPNDACVDGKTVDALLDISTSTRQRHVKSGSIPKPHKLSERTLRWNVGELRQALASKKGA